jgi:hypothetical protein
MFDVLQCFDPRRCLLVACQHGYDEHAMPAECLCNELKRLLTPEG